MAATLYPLPVVPALDLDPCCESCGKEITPNSDWRYAPYCSLRCQQNADRAAAVLEARKQPWFKVDAR